MSSREIYLSKLNRRMGSIILRIKITIINHRIGDNHEIKKIFLVSVKNLNQFWWIRDEMILQTNMKNKIIFTYSICKFLKKVFYHIQVIDLSWTLCQNMSSFLNSSVVLICIFIFFEILKSQDQKKPYI